MRSHKEYKIRVSGRIAVPLSTNTLPGALRTEVKSLLAATFGDDFSDHDWQHALGGVHVWLSDSGRVISHASLVERTLACSGERIRVGYVEAVATLSPYRRNGYGSLVMTRIGELIRERYTLGALSTGTHAFYEKLGWERWRGPSFVDDPCGRARTPDDDGSVMVLRTARSPEVDLDGEIVCDWRRGDVW